MQWHNAMWLLRSRWLESPRRSYAVVCFLGSRVRIPMNACVYDAIVCCVLCS